MAFHLYPFCCSPPGYFPRLLYPSTPFRVFYYIRLLPCDFALALLCFILLVRLFSVCAVVPIFITFWGVTEFQDTYHGFCTFYLFLVFLCGFFILLVREKHRKTLYRFLLQK